MNDEFDDPELYHAAWLGAVLRAMRQDLDADAIERVLMWALGRYGIKVSTLLRAERDWRPRPLRPATRPQQVERVGDVEIPVITDAERAAKFAAQAAPAAPGTTPAPETVEDTDPTPAAAQQAASGLDGAARELLAEPAAILALADQLRPDALALLDRALCPICGRGPFDKVSSHLTTAHRTNRAKIEAALALAERAEFADAPAGEST